jgi:hypothetical protein
MTTLPSSSFPVDHMPRILGRLSAPFEFERSFVPLRDPGILRLPDRDPLGDASPSEMALSSSFLTSWSSCFKICFPSLSLPADHKERIEPLRPALSVLANGVL